MHIFDIFCTFYRETRNVWKEACTNPATPLNNAFVPWLVHTSWCKDSKSTWSIEMKFVDVLHPYRLIQSQRHTDSGYVRLGAASQFGPRWEQIEKMIIQSEYSCWRRRSGDQNRPALHKMRTITYFVFLVACHIQLSLQREIDNVKQVNIYFIHAIKL